MNEFKYTGGMLSLEAGKFWESFLNEVFNEMHITVVTMNTLYGGKMDVEPKVQFDKAICYDRGDGTARLSIVLKGGTYSGNDVVRFNPEQRTLHTFSSDDHRSITRLFIMPEPPSNKEQRYRMFELAEESLRF